MLSGEDLLLTVYRAFNARDIESVLAAMHPGVDWPNGWEGGRIQGRDAVREYWTRQWSAINPRVEPLRFYADDSNRIIVDVHALIRDKNDKIIADEIIQHIYVIEEGLIRSMEIRKPEVSSPAAR
jgi:nuclear transport factor 2 (NTF2) superfamily protein